MSWGQGPGRHATHLDRTGEQMSVVRETRGERRAVKEGELGPAFGQLLLGLEGIDLAPKVQHIVLGGRDVDGLRGWGQRL